MADGGMASLGGMTSSTPNTPTVASRDNSRNLQTPQGTQSPVGNPQKMADGSIQGGDGEQNYGYKKGGQVTTRRVSTGSTSKKSPCW
jgi:hypothetical protein